jgi:hypothetical protein
MLSHLTPSSPRGFISPGRAKQWALAAQASLASVDKRRVSTVQEEPAQARTSFPMTPLLGASHAWQTREDLHNRRVGGLPFGPADFASVSALKKGAFGISGILVAHSPKLNLREMPQKAAFRMNSKCRNVPGVPRTDRGSI